VDDVKLLEALDEGISALYGAKGVCGDIANISLAIRLLEDVKGRPTPEAPKARDERPLVEIQAENEKLRKEVGRLRDVNAYLDGVLASKSAVECVDRVFATKPYGKTYAERAKEGATVIHTYAEQYAQERVREVAFGKGQVVVNHGYRNGVPSVCIEPVEEHGEVGASAEHLNLPRDRVKPGSIILTFPTEAQAEAVEDALVSSHPAAEDKRVEKSNESKSAVGDKVNIVARIKERLSVYASKEPEEDESWESWYHAAFDLLASDIDALAATGKAGA